MTRKEKLIIEGYKSLTQYGCQLSADHISTDRIMIPLSLAPALLVLAPQNGHVSGFAKTMILVAGVFLILFWMYRNRRNAKRLSAIWDILRLIEAQLGFEAHIKLKIFMESLLFENGQWRKLQSSDSKPPTHDFKLKRTFGIAVLCFYGLVLVYVWWEHIVSRLCC